MYAPKYTIYLHYFRPSPDSQKCVRVPAHGLTWVRCDLAYYIHMCLVTVRVADLIAQEDPSKLYPSCAELNVYGIKQILRIVTSRT